MPLPQHNSPADVDPSQTSNAGGNPSASGALAGEKFNIQEFSREERGLLLRLAHDSVASALEKLGLSLDAPTPHLAERRGAFTSLYLRRGREKELRGCVGYVLPTCSVYRAVAETARAAAFEDPRFHPVTKQEAPHLAIELSVLSMPKAIHPEEVEVGRHGLLISGHGRRGLLLPQVAVEHGWDRARFLEQTCRKALLPADAWQKGAAVEPSRLSYSGMKVGCDG